MVKGIPKIKNIKIESGRPRGICDFCLKKGETYRLGSRHRKYRFLSVCKECLNKVRQGFG